VKCKNTRIMIILMLNAGIKKTPKSQLVEVSISASIAIRPQNSSW
jgi:hypothetical protein